MGFEGTLPENLQSWLDAAIDAIRAKEPFDLSFHPWGRPPWHRTTPIEQRNKLRALGIPARILAQCQVCKLYQGSYNEECIECKSKKVERLNPFQW